MDLIYTNAHKADQGVLKTYAFDLSFGADENDFEMTVSANYPALEFGSFVYIEGTEYGGIIDAIKVSTNGQSITYTGRTWHGMLNSKIIEPDAGQDYLKLSGDLNSGIASVLSRCGLGDLFVATSESCGISETYQFHRYCKAYDGLRDYVNDCGAKLVMSWRNRKIVLSAVPVADYTESPIDGDIASLSVEKHDNRVNHLICLGSGNLSEREIIHLYADQNGNIVDTPYYTGLDEVADTYDYGNVESSEELRKGGIERMRELRDNDKAEISLIEGDVIAYDIGDIVGAKEQRTGVSVASVVTQKIVKIINGAVSTEYKIGG